MLRSILGVLLILTVSTSTPELNDKTYAQWRDHIRPTREETSWQTIPWQPTFWNAVLEAQRLEKPILVWAMNGHPLACT